MEMPSDDSFHRELLDAVDFAVSVSQAVRDASGAIVDFRTVYLNGQSVRLSGIPREEQVGRSWGELAPQLLESDLFEDWRKVVEQDTQITRSLDLDVSVLQDYQVTGSYELNARKWRDGVLTISRDISDRIALEHQREARERAERFNRQIIGGLVEAQRSLDTEDYAGTHRAMSQTLAAAGDMVRELAPTRIT